MLSHRSISAMVFSFLTIKLSVFQAHLLLQVSIQGAVVNDANTDIMNIFMNFEHSYMGDITITFICPNGQSILVHQQGGAGTYS